MALADEDRKRIADALNSLSPDRADPLRARLERAQPPIDPYESGQTALVVDEYVLVLGSNLAVLAVLTKAAYLAEADDVWRYGLFAGPDCFRPFANPRRAVRAARRRRGPQGKAFWTSKRSWKGPHDPEIKNE